MTEEKKETGTPNPSQEQSVQEKPKQDEMATSTQPQEVQPVKEEFKEEDSFKKAYK